MNERDKELAKQADDEFTGEYNDHLGHCLVGTEAIQKFADLIRADERERIKVANAPEIERINAHIKTLEDVVKNEREKVIAEFVEAGVLGYDGTVVQEIRARGNT